MIFETYSPEETKKMAKKIASKANKGDIYCLVGALGVGKTIFTKGFAEGLNIYEHITSPTFMIVNEYDGDIPFYHFDVYRISDVEEMYEIGYEEYFFGQGICLIEWANLIKEIIPQDVFWITIEKDLQKGLDYRKITMEEEQK